METQFGIRNARPFSVALGADDTDEAFRIGMRNPSHSTYTAATAVVNAGTSLVLTITGHASSPFTFAFATYTTIGALCDAVELDADVGPLVYINRTGMLRAWLTADLAARGSTSFRTDAGLGVLWDTSDLDRRVAVIGPEADSTISYGQARTSAANIPDRDGGEQLNQHFNASEYTNMLTSLTLTATWNASAQTVAIYELTNKAGDTDPSAIFTYSFTGTGSAQTVNIGPPGMASLSASIGDGLRANRAGRRLLVVTGDGSNAITSSTGSIAGVIGN